MQTKRPQWTRTESRILREWIKADSKKRPLGAHVNCCSCCYGRNCPCLVYIMCSMFALTALTLFITFCFRIIVPYNNASKFEPATCATQNSRYKLNKVMCCYNSERCHWNNCLEVNVTMTTPGGMTVNTILYQDLDTMSRARCSYEPRCDTSFYVTNLRIERFNSSYGGGPARPFSCLYNRQAPRQVVVTVRRASLWDSHVVTHVTVWPLVVVFVCLLTLTITFFICGCQPHVCPSRPSAALRTEAYLQDREDKELTSEKALASRNEEAFRKFYAMQGMPVPPPVNNTGPLQDGGLLHSPSEFQAILDHSA